MTMEDERWCEEVAQPLLEGKKGEELAAAVRDLESRSSAVRLVLVRRCLYTNNNTSSIGTGGCRAFSCRTTITLRSAV